MLILQSLDPTVNEYSGMNSSDKPIHRVFSEVISKYTPKKASQHQQPFLHPPEAHTGGSQTNELLTLYKQLVLNLKQHRNHIHHKLNQEAAKNDTFFLSLINNINDVRTSTQNWMHERISEVGDIFNNLYLEVQIRMYRLSKKEQINLEQEKNYYQKVTALELPVFQFVPIEGLDTLVRELSTVRTPNHKSKPSPPQTQQTPPPISIENSPVHDEYGLECNESIWHGPVEETVQHRTYISPYDIIMEQSQSQESSLISTTDFI